MKKLLTICFLVFLLSCSSSSDDSTSNYFNPPSWIRGTWKNPSNPVGYKFTSDDFCTLTSTLQLCNKENLNSYEQSGIDVSVDETTSSIEYSFSIETNGTIQSYTFIKISADEIELENPTSGQPNLSLYKQ